jgi:multicomponent Na+:H+ antiporter subunit D
MSTGTRNLDEMGGLARRMPLTAATSLVGSLSIAGVPPLPGFWSKLMIIMALVQAAEWPLAVVAILASVLTLWYYLLIQRKAFFGKLEERWKEVREAPFWMSFSTVFLSLLIIAIGILFAAVIKTWIEPAAGVLGQGTGAVIGPRGF